MIFLRLDDPKATQFHVPGAERLDGTPCTFTDGDAHALGRAVVRMIAADTVELIDAQMLSAGQGFRVLREDMVDATAISRGEVVRRREQAAFRRRVGEVWGWRCAITGETVREVLEAAHLPGSSWRAGDNRAVDGILLRLDLHRLMDAGLLRIEGGSVRVSVGTYAALDGVQVIWPPRKPKRRTNA